MLTLVPTERHAETMAASGGEVMSFLRFVTKLGTLPVEVKGKAPRQLRPATRASRRRVIEEVLGRAKAGDAQLAQSVLRVPSATFAIDACLGGLHQRGTEARDFQAAKTPVGRLTLGLLRDMPSVLASKGLYDQRDLRAVDITGAPGSVEVRGAIDLGGGLLDLLARLHRQGRSRGGSGVTIHLGRPPEDEGRALEPIERRFAELEDAPQLELSDAVPASEQSISLVEAVSLRSEARAVAVELLRGLRAGARSDRTAVVVDDGEEAFLEALRIELREAKISWAERSGPDLGTASEPRALFAILSMAEGRIGRDELIDVLRTPGLHSGSWVRETSAASARVQADILAHALRNVPLLYDESGVLLRECIGDLEVDAVDKIWMVDAVERLSADLERLRGVHDRQGFCRSIGELCDRLQLGLPNCESGAPSLSYTTTGSRLSSKVLQVLVVVQILGCIWASVIAVAIGRSVLDLRRQSLGYNVIDRGILAITMRSSGSFITDSRGGSPIARAVDQLLSRISQMPGVRFAGVALAAPLETSAKFFTIHDLSGGSAGSRQIAIYNGVTPGYFQALGTRLTAGRGLVGRPLDGDPSEVVINEALRKQMWPYSDPIGRMINLEDSDLGFSVNVRIVGISEDQRMSGPIDHASPAIYVPLSGTIFAGGLPLYLIVDSAEPLFRLEAATNHVLSSVFPSLGVSFSYRLQDRLRDSLSKQTLRGIFALGGAVAIAVVAYLGLYSSLLYFLATKRREIAIRICCGAASGAIFRIVMWRAALSGIYAATGAILSLPLLRLMVESGWIGTAKWSWEVATGAAFAALVATWLIALPPAMLATQLTPMEVIRDDG